MCGITGFIGSGGAEILKSMVETLKQRGPNDDGILLKGNVGLGHTRLSVIDLSKAGHQPMLNGDKTIALVYNGEIYNFRELRRELEELNKYPFKSNTDSEVILYMYEEYGEECFKMLNGMFAIAIYDFRSGKLILARDRMGEKPLYFGVFDGTFIFGSEIKSILKHGSFKKKLDINSVRKYFAYEYIPTPHTIFHNLYKLKPATYLIYTDGNIEEKKFWEINFNKSDDTLNIAVNKLDELLNESVKKMLTSDAPLGIFLSGGIDSSAIAYYAQKNSDKKIKTFSIGFREKSFDETRYARRVASLLGAEHYERNISSKEAIDMIRHMVDVMDEPLADDSIIPTLILSKFAKENVTVALSGDGADELFLGYPTFKADRLARGYGLIPRFIRTNIIKKIINKIPVSNSYFSAEFKLKKFVNGFEGDKRYMHQRWLGGFSAEDIGLLFNRKAKETMGNNNIFEDIDNHPKYENKWNDLIYQYLKFYLMDDILVKTDRSSMSYSLEVRAPFLDYKLVDYINSLPVKFKLKGNRTKYILKKLMKGKLPGGILNRKKQGFALPVAEWLRGDLKEFCDETLSQKNMDKIGLFDYNYIEKLKREHFSKKNNHKQKLWALLVFTLWHNRWVIS